MLSKRLLALFAFSFSIISFAAGVFATTLWTSECNGQICEWGCCYDGSFYCCDGSGSSSNYYNNNYYCDYDSYCEVGELSSCSDCSTNYNNNYYCDYDSYCEVGELSSCSDCYTNNNYYCDHDGWCESGEPSCCSDCSNNNYYCDYDGWCESGETSSCSDCSNTCTNCNTCNYQTPTVVLDPSSQQGSIGTTLTYRVTVSNRDSTNCGSATFSLTPSCPTGWTCVLDLSSLTISPGSTGTTNMRVTSASGSGSGSYSVSTAASRSSYGSATGYATYILNSPACTEGYTNNYRCNGDYRQREYRFSNCNIEWKDYERCSNGCSSGSCSGSCNSGNCNNNCNSNVGGCAYYPPTYYYPVSTVASSVATETVKEVVVAEKSCSLPYEGEVGKPQIYAQTIENSPNDGIYVMVIIFLIILLFILLLALLAWLLRRNGSKERSSSSERTKRETKCSETRNFWCWNEKKRDSAECFPRKDKE
jgi:hypothetical protein